MPAPYEDQGARISILANGKKSQRPDTLLQTDQTIINVTGPGRRRRSGFPESAAQGTRQASAHARSAIHSISAQLRALASEVDRLEAQILDWHRNDETSRTLATIPGIGPITASAVAAAVPYASVFRSGRQFAAWLGLTPRANS